MNGVQVAYAWLGPLRVPPEYSSLGWFATIETLTVLTKKKSGPNKAAKQQAGHVSAQRNARRIRTLCKKCRSVLTSAPGQRKAQKSAVVAQCRRSRNALGDFTVGRHVDHPGGRDLPDSTHIDQPGKGQEKPRRGGNSSDQRARKILKHEYVDVDLLQTAGPSSRRRKKETLHWGKQNTRLLTRLSQQREQEDFDSHGRLIHGFKNGRWTAPTFSSYWKQRLTMKLVNTREHIVGEAEA